MPSKKILFRYILILSLSINPTYLFAGDGTGALFELIFKILITVACIAALIPVAYRIFLSRTKPHDLKTLILIFFKYFIFIIIIGWLYIFLRVNL